MAKSIRIPLAGLALTTLALAAAAQSSNAQTAQTRDYHIESQPLPAAVNDWADQAGLQVMWSARMPGAQREAPEVAGRFSAPVALERVLQGSGLTFAFLDEQTVAIRLASAAVQSSPSQVSGKVGDQAMTRSAEGAGLLSPSRGEGQGEDSKQSVRGGDSAATSQEESISEVVVTGTHIRGVSKLASPVITIDRTEIERSGYTTIESVMRDLPQNFSAVGNASGYGDSSALPASNVDRASAIDLRGLGAGSTLTLINGTRRAGSVAGQVVDISAIPLSMINSVEIVTGGRSATYGSDAVGGVVNIETRNRFEGAESRLSYGLSTEHSGGNALSVSQLFGTTFQRGGIVAAYDYQHEDALDLVSTGVVVIPRPVDGATPLRRDLDPDSSRHSGMLSGHFSLTDRIELTGDALYSRRAFAAVESDLRVGTTVPSTSNSSHTSDQYGVAGKASIVLPADWAMKFSGALSEVSNRYSAPSETHSELFDFGLRDVERDKSRITYISVIADGPLLSVAGLTPRIAIGVDGRKEFLSTYNSQQLEFPLGNFLDPTITEFSRKRDVWSAFGEILMPLAGGSMAAWRQVDLSVAGRYDHYDDFGGTFNPQAGLIWRPTNALTVRAAYSEAFRAPALIELSTRNTASLIEYPDGAQGGAFIPVLTWSGSNQNLHPETANTWSVGLDFAPITLPELRISLDYFDISYNDRLDVVSTDLIDSTRYAQLIDRSPTSGEVAAILSSATSFFNGTDISFDPTTQNLLDIAPNLVIFDSRTNNLATERVRGIDLRSTSDVELPVGTLHLGLNTSYTFNHVRRITSASPSFSIINEIGKPVDFRARFMAGWSGDAFGAYAYVNYTDEYVNQFALPNESIASWTTIDLSFQYSAPQNDAQSWLNGLTGSLTFQNALDAAPPEYRNNAFGLRYDTANANPVGRFVSLSVAKRW